MQHPHDLNKDTLAELDRAAAGTRFELEDFLDRLSGDARAMSSELNPHIIARRHVVPRGSVDPALLDTQDLRGLAQVLDGDDPIDQVVACIRILSMTDYTLSSQRPPVSEVEIDRLLTRAQRVLSAHLLAHPALLHPRIFIKSSHKLDAEYGPIAFVMSLSARAELPRFSHGFPEEHIREFARHPCVRAAFREAAPMAPLSNGRRPRFQGRTLLSTSSDAGTRGSSVNYVGDLRPHFFLSVLELDEYAARDTPSGEQRLPSLLETQDPSVVKLIERRIVGCFLDACDIRYTPRNLFSRNFDQVVRILQQSAVADSDWFMKALEPKFTIWTLMDPPRLVASLRRTADALLKLQPRALHELHEPDRRHQLQPAVTSEMVAKWLTASIMNGNPTELANSAEVAKEASQEHQRALFQALDSIAPQAWPDIHMMVEGYVESYPPDVAAEWLVTLRDYTMRRAMTNALTPVSATTPRMPESRTPDSRRRARLV